MGEDDDPSHCQSGSGKVEVTGDGLERTHKCMVCMEASFVCMPCMHLGLCAASARPIAPLAPRAFAQVSSDAIPCTDRMHLSSPRHHPETTSGVP
eukprot:1501283-Rhodomonas_salina.1